MSTVRATNITDLTGTYTSTTTAIANGIAKAWVNFNGTTSSPSTIRASYNVSSVTKNGTGDYTINFTTALTDANYVVNCESAPDNASGSAGAWIVGVLSASGSGPLLKTTTQVRIRTSDLSGTGRDYYNAGLTIFR